MRLLTSALLLLTVCVFSSCDRDDINLNTNWTRMSDFAGSARTGAVAFTIDGKAYVGTGTNGTERLSDFWQYDQATDTWTRIADFPGVARSGAVGFAANGKGYVGTGFDGTGNLQDFWEFDPANGTWTQIADFPGTARYGAVAVSLGNSGYIGGGYDGSYRKDFWQYDPTTDTWTERTEFSGARRLNGFAFVVNNKAYVGGGINNGILEADFMEYDPATDTWRNLRSLNSADRVGTDFPIPRAYATAFGINNRGYLFGGMNGAVPSNAGALTEVWEYNPASDTWREVSASSSAASRQGAVGFTIGNNGYIGLGRNGVLSSKELWQFDVAGGD